MKNQPLGRKILVYILLLAYSHTLFSSDGEQVTLTGPDGTQIEGTLTPDGNFCVGNDCVPVEFCQGDCSGYLVTPYEPSEGEGLVGAGTDFSQGGGGPIDNSWQATFGQNTIDIFASRQAALDRSLDDMEAQWAEIGKGHSDRIMGNDANPFSIDVGEITAAIDAQVQQSQQIAAMILIAYAAMETNIQETRDKIGELNRQSEDRLKESLSQKFPIKIEERNKLWTNISDAKTQHKGKLGSIIASLETGTLVTAPESGGFASSAASLGGEKVRRLDKYVASVQRSLEAEGPLSSERKLFIGDAKASNSQADAAYARGDKETGDALIRIGYALADAAVALSPIVVAALVPGAPIVIAVVGAVAIGKSWYEARTGKRIWDGSALSVMDQQLAYLDVGLSMLPGAAELLTLSGKTISKALDTLSGPLKAGMGGESATSINRVVDGAKELAEKLDFASGDIAQDFVRWLRRPVHPNLEAGVIGEGGDRALEVIKGLRPEVATLEASSFFKDVPRALRPNVWDIMENLPLALKGNPQANNFINQLFPHPMTRDPALKGYISLDLVPNDRTASPLRFLYKVMPDGSIRWMIKDTHK